MGVRGTFSPFPPDDLLSGRPGGLSGGPLPTLSPSTGLIGGRRTTLETVYEPSENFGVSCGLGNIFWGIFSGGGRPMKVIGVFSGEFLGEGVMVVVLVVVVVVVVVVGSLLVGG